MYVGWLVGLFYCVSGVVYAHRNEDVVNMGRGGIQQQMGGKPRVPLREDSTTMQQPRSISTPVAPPPPPASSVGGMKDDDEKNLYKEEESSDSSPSKSKRQKPEQWKNSLLAVFMGMEEAELTKLLHSESESSHDKHKHDGDPVGCREDPNGWALPTGLFPQSPITLYIVLCVSCLCMCIVYV